VKINKEILALALPNIISNISVPLISSVDTALMGSLSSLHIGAVGLGSMIFNFVYWNFGFLRMGTTGMTAQAYGRTDEAAVIHNLGRALLLAVGFSSLILLLQQPLAWLGFRLMNVSAEQYELVATYFFIRIWVAPVTLSLMAMMGWFFGMQNAIFPLILTFIINITNILASYLLVVHYQLGVAGVAWGTVLAQVVGLIAAFVLFFLRYRQYVNAFQQKLFWATKAFGGFLRVNSDIFLRTFSLTIAFGFFYSQSAAVGPELLAINTILLQFLNWMSFGVDGFAYAAESLVGKYTGANDRRHTHEAIRLSMWWGLGLACIYSLIYGVFGEAILNVFTDEADLIAATKPYLWWVIALPIIGTPCYIWDGVFVGLTASRSMRNSMFVALVAYFVVYYGQTSFTEYNNSHQATFLWLALLTFLAVRGLLQWGLFRYKGLDLE